MCGIFEKKWVFRTAFVFQMFIYYVHKVFKLKLWKGKQNPDSMVPVWQLSNSIFLLQETQNEEEVQFLQKRVCDIIYYVMKNSSEV